MGYPELCHTPAETSVYFLTGEGILGDSVVPSSKSRLLSRLIGNKELHCMQCRGNGPHLSGSGKSHVFLELRSEPGICSRVTAGVDIRNFCLFRDVRTPV